MAKHVVVHAHIVDLNGEDQLRVTELTGELNATKATYIAHQIGSTHGQMKAVESDEGGQTIVYQDGMEVVAISTFSTDQLNS